MNVETIEKILDETKSEWEGDNCYKGLCIISKYTKEVITGVGHDTVYSEDVEKIIEAGITIGDVKALGELNWHVDEDGECFACFI